MSTIFIQQALRMLLNGMMLLVTGGTNTGQGKRDEHHGQKNQERNSFSHSVSELFGDTKVR